MSVPTTREEFRYNVLRRIGGGVVEINLDSESIEDRIDEALDYWQMYAYDSTEHVYYTYLLTPTDITNKFITIPTNIQGVVRILVQNNGILNGSDIFNVNYQITMNDIYNFSSISMVPYFMVQEQLSLLSEVLIGQDPVRFNRHTGQLHVDTNWSYLSPGQYMIVEAYQILDGDTYSAIWSDRWLQKYASALIQRNWGKVLTKTLNIQLPGGGVLNGQQILADAEADIKELENTMINSYSEPPQPVLY